MFTLLHSYRCVAAAIILAAAPLAEAANVPEPLPAEGAVTENLVKDSIRILKEENAVTISGLCPNDYAPIGRVTAHTQVGSTQSPVTVNNWQWQQSTTAVDWLVLIDVSDSMRKPFEQRNFLRESVDATLQLLSTVDLSGGETIQVMATAENLTPVGKATNVESKLQLQNELQKIRKTAGRLHMQGNSQTAYVQHIEGLIRNLPQPSQGRTVSVILLSDGDDDSSSNISPIFMDLVAAASQKGVHVNCIGFQRQARRTGINNLETLANRTGGNMVLCAGSALRPESMNGISLREHKPGGSLSLPVLNTDFEALHVECYRTAETTPCGKLILQKSVLQTARETPDATPPNAAALVGDIESNLTAAAEAIKELSRADRPADAQPTNRQLQATINEKVAAALAPTQALKQLPIADVEAAINQAKAREGISEQMKAVLDKLAALCRDTQIQTVTEAHIRSLLETPAAPVRESAEQTSPYVKWCGITLIFLIPIIIVVVLLRKMFRKEPEPVQGAKIPETPVFFPANNEKELRFEEKEVTPAPVAPPIARPGYLFNVQTGECHKLSTEIVRIGRATDNDVCFTGERSVSYYHCAMKLQHDEEWSISDLGSSNGVYVNDRKVEQTILQDNDIIELGKLKLRFSTTK